MNQPLLSIIIVSFNTSKLTQDCLQSIRQDKGLKDIPYEIIVIDNASTDTSVSMLKKQKDIQLILNRQNLGFAKANNQGIKIARGIIFFSSTDTVILHSAISQSLNWLAPIQAHGCTASTLKLDKSIQPSGGYFPNLLNVFTWSVGLMIYLWSIKLSNPFTLIHPGFTLEIFYQSASSRLAHSVLIF